MNFKRTIECDIYCRSVLYTKKIILYIILYSVVYEMIFFYFAELMSVSMDGDVFFRKIVFIIRRAERDCQSDVPQRPFIYRDGDGDDATTVVRRGDRVVWKNGTQFLYIVQAPPRKSFYFYLRNSSRSLLFPRDGKHSLSDSGDDDGDATLSRKRINFNRLRFRVQQRLFTLQTRYGFNTLRNCLYGL